MPVANYEFAAVGPPESPAGPVVAARVEDRERNTVTDELARHVDFFALYVIRQGRGLHVIGGAPFDVARGDVYLMAPGMTHQYAKYNDLALDAVYFLHEALTEDERAALQAEGGMELLLPERPPAAGSAARLLHLSPPAYRRIEEELREIRQECARRTPAGMLLARIALVRLLFRLVRMRGGDIERQEEPACLPAQSLDASVADTVRLIDTRFAEPLLMHKIAADLGTSLRALNRRFTHVMGRSARDYLTYVRLENARTLLAKEDIPVNEAGRLSGFPEPAYFSRVFRAHTGQSPTAYRRMRHEGESS